MNYQNQVLQYFAKKASEYDLVDLQVYWKLSDHLLWEALQSLALSAQKPDFDFLDAGGGTGRWSQKILTAYEKARGVLYDLSIDMLKEAETKVSSGGLIGRLDLVRGDIQNMKDLDDEMFDIVLNFHNVLGFVDSPDLAVKEMARVLKKEGHIVCVVPNLYHNIYFNLLYGNIEQAKQTLDTSRGKFTFDMPHMHLFTPESISKIYYDNGLKDVVVFGFPVTIYPGFEETQIKGTTKRISNILDSSENFRVVYELEKQLMYKHEAASRGNNLFVIGRK